MTPAGQKLNRGLAVPAKTMFTVYKGVKLLVTLFLDILNEFEQDILRTSHKRATLDPTPTEGFTILYIHQKQKQPTHYSQTNKHAFEKQAFSHTKPTRLF